MDTRRKHHNHPNIIGFFLFPESQMSRRSQIQQKQLFPESENIPVAC